MSKLSLKTKTALMSVAALILAACSYESGLLRTLTLDTAIPMSCAEESLKSAGFKTYPDDTNIFYERLNAAPRGRLEFKKSSKGGYKKIIHGRYSANECFEDVDAVAAQMKTLEAQILQSCGAALSKPTTQELDRNGRKMCGKN